VKKFFNFSQKEKLHFILGVMLIFLFLFQLYWMIPALMSQMKTGHFVAVIKLGIFVPIIIGVILYFTKQTYDKLNDR